MSKENVIKFQEEIVLLVGGSANGAGTVGLFCASCYYLSSVLNRAYHLEEKYKVKILGVSYDTEFVKPICFYKIKDLETDEISVIQIV